MNATTILALVIAANLAAMIWHLVEAIQYRRARQGTEHMLRSVRNLHNRLSREHVSEQLRSSFIRGWVRR
jgi:hypothetical protein